MSERQWPSYGAPRPPSWSQPEPGRATPTFRPPYEPLPDPEPFGAPPSRVPYLPPDYAQLAPHEVAPAPPGPRPAPPPRQRPAGVSAAGAGVRAVLGMLMVPLALLTAVVLGLQLPGLWSIGHGGGQHGIINIQDVHCNKGGCSSDGVWISDDHSRVIDHAWVPERRTLGEAVPGRVLPGRATVYRDGTQPVVMGAFNTVGAALMAVLFGAMSAVGWRELRDRRGRQT